MNILFIYSSAIIPENGGVQRVTHDLQQYLASKGHNVIFLTLFKEKYNAKENSIQYFLPIKKLLSKRNIDYYISLVKTEGIDIIINQDGMNPNLTKFCAQIKRYKEVKIICVFHNSLLGNIKNFAISHANQIKSIPIPFLNKIFEWKLIRNILTKFYIFKYTPHYQNIIRNYNQIVTLSEAYFEELKAFVPNGNFSKVCSIPNPCNLKLENIHFQKVNELIYIGRLNSTQKRVDLLLQIWNLIFKKHPTWKLSILGDGPERYNLENMSKDLGLKKVHFYGNKNPIEYYKRAKILCMTSAYEGFPLVLAEAQTFGTIPIAFNSFASITDIIKDGDNGLLIEPFNISKYASILSELMENEEKIYSMSRECQKSASRFSIEIIGGKWDTLLTQIN